jgi:hypothetical protein
MSCYKYEDQGFIPGGGMDISIRPSSPGDPGAHPALYPVGTVGSFRRDKPAGV